jgi:hypothetical protein
MKMAMPCGSSIIRDKKADAGCDETQYIVGKLMAFTLGKEAFMKEYEKNKKIQLIASLEKGIRYGGDIAQPGFKEST